MMTDEQYIDSLFQQEPCGYQNTPGFRAFLLDAMATIGERPRAGDVASMHMAYTAGKEHGIARTWTDERPTEPGEYWVSKSKHLRAVERDKMREVTVRFTEWHPTELQVFDVSGSLLGPVKGTWLDDSKWSRRETPADPFEVTK